MGRRWAPRPRDLRAAGLALLAGVGLVAAAAGHGDESWWRPGLGAPAGGDHHWYGGHPWWRVGPGVHTEINFYAGVHAPWTFRELEMLDATLGWGAPPPVEYIVLVDDHIHVPLDP